MMRKWRFLNGLIPVLIGEVGTNDWVLSSGSICSFTWNVSPYHAIKNGLVTTVICIPHIFGLWFENPTKKKTWIVIVPECYVLVASYTTTMSATCYNVHDPSCT